MSVSRATVNLAEPYLRGIGPVPAASRSGMSS